MINKNKSLVTLSIFLFLFSFLFFSPHTTHASTGLTIQPVKVSETMKAGEAISGTILLSNASDEAVEVDVTTQDFIPLAGAEGLQFVDHAPGLTSVKDWITIGGGKKFTLKKSESKEIGYTINAPINAEPGSHFGVAFFKAIKLSDATQQLKIGTQVGMLILVTIPGNHLQKGQIRDFTTNSFVQSGPVHFKMKFENTGTVHFEPKGTIQISNMFGHEVASIPIEGQVVLPTGVKDLNFSWNVSGLLLGKYSAVANVVDGEGNVLTSKTVSFYAFPLWYIFSFFVTILILFLIFRTFKRKFKFSVSVR